jgi:hypothetical protein
VSSLRGDHAKDAGTTFVTEENLLANERVWPYHVALIAPWQPPGREKPLRTGALGVLIRVEPSGMARIDFGRDGLHEVPIGQTDLVDRANRVRRGESDKMAPNFLLAIGPRLVDSASASLRPFVYEQLREVRGFLCVFADGDEEDIARLAEVLGTFRERPGLATILLPQGNHHDAQVRERLRALNWTVPFVFDHLSELYTRTLLAEGTPLPALMLLTGEGRVLFRSSWGEDVAAALTSALDDNLGPGPDRNPVADPKPADPR